MVQQDRKMHAVLAEQHDLAKPEQFVESNCVALQPLHL